MNRVQSFLRTACAFLGLSKAPRGKSKRRSSSVPVEVKRSKVSVRRLLVPTRPVPRAIQRQLKEKARLKRIRRAQRNLDELISCPSKGIQSS